MSRAAEVLEAAAKRLEQPGAWTKDNFALRDDGKVALGDDPRAKCWCMLGAIQAEVMDPGLRSRAHYWLEKVTGGDAPHFNDAPGRTQDEVVAKLREAAALARQEQAA